MNSWNEIYKQSLIWNFNISFLNFVLLPKNKDFDIIIEEKLK